MGQSPFWPRQKDQTAFNKFVSLLLVQFGNAEKKAELGGKRQRMSVKGH